MKCPYCGGEVALEDKECPYCGRPNEQSVQHRKDMARFQRRFSAAEKTVTKKTKGYTRILPLVLVILFLVIAIEVMAGVSEQAWQFPENARRRATQHDPAPVCAMLDEYLERGDYAGFESCADYYKIPYDGVFSGYEKLLDCADEYADLIRIMESLFLHRDETETWREWDVPSDLRHLSSSIVIFYGDVNYALKWEELSESEMGYAADMRETMTGMLDYYLGLDSEKLEEFLAMPGNRQPVYLEEVIFGAQ